MTIFENLLEIKKQINDLQEQEALIKKAILAETDNKPDLKRIELEEGLITVAESTKWTFSKSANEQISAKKKEIKQIELEDIESGKAESSIAKSVRITLKK